MEKRGKFFENIVAVIQESYRDNPNAKIFLNAKALSQTGGEREVDVLIQTISNGIPHSIVVECKDHNKPINVSLIESFVTKCTDINADIKVFVSKNGFQKEAIAVAAKHNINLFNLEELLIPQIWNDILPKELAIFKEKLELEGIQINFAGDSPNNSVLPINEIKIGTLEDTQSYDLIEFIDYQILMNRRAIYLPLLEQMRDKSPNV
jgi:hypothetical protein